ncbi:DinB family protein [Candidatus Leptofilum sp.]|uniref:DinB family protein n=1 Tax=Candidatus Leptofilum sp. TaxID=3241576 RepID=UPI003B5B894C
MLDFTPVRNKEMSYAELVADLTVADLRDLTNEIIDYQLGLLADCTDADVVFEPNDPEANDPYAEDEADTDLAWNLGHLIVHVTASSEEGAALAAEMARGVVRDGRSRSEVPWQTVKTVAQCRQRLEESRRMRLASLEMWPDEPYLDNVKMSERLGRIDAYVRFVYGYSHDQGHLAQIERVIAQAKAARGA